jgi:outer membrane protein assembly factor BamB
VTDDALAGRKANDKAGELQMSAQLLRRGAIRRVGVIWAVVVAVGGLAPAGFVGVASAAGCPASGQTPGGEWPMYGHDLANTRTQSGETELPPVRAATLRPAWSFSFGHSSSVLGFADLNGTPIVSHGCVFAGDERGKVVALSAATGGLVWQNQVGGTPRPQDSSALINGSPVVSGDLVIFAVSELGAPYLVAFDISTGEQRWKSPPLVTDPGSFTNSSPMSWNGEVVIGFSEPEGVVTAHGGFAIVDAANGSLLDRTYTIPPNAWARGYGGGGIWSTAAIDPATGYAYYGTGNPFNKTAEYPTTNAIIKLDMDPRRSTFGSIVASYKGEIDQRLEVLKKLTGPTTCKLLPENPIPPLPLPPFVPDLNQLKDSFACLQFDLDFGGSPNLISGPGGPLVGELQKSGTYHIVSAATLGPVRKVALGLSCLVCNGASTAYDPVTGEVVADVAPGSLLTGFAAATGARRWVAPVADTVHYQPVADADGVVYTLDSLGFLDGYDERSGLPLLHRPLVLDGATDATAPLASGGVSIAGHTVYVAAGSHVIAYKSAGPA